MKELKFTPEPWFPVEYAGYWEIQDGPNYGDNSILDIEKNLHAEGNATLASKAPEMYSALLKAKEAFGYIKELLAPLKASQDEPENIAFHEAYKALSEINKILES